MIFQKIIYVIFCLLPIKLNISRGMVLLDSKVIVKSDRSGNRGDTKPWNNTLAQFVYITSINQNCILYKIVC